MILYDQGHHHGRLNYVQAWILFIFLGLAQQPFCPVASFCALVTFLFTLPPHWHVFIDTCNTLSSLFVLLLVSSPWHVAYCGTLSDLLCYCLVFLYRHRVQVLLVVFHPMALSSYHCIAFLVIYLPGSFLLVWCHHIPKLTVTNVLGYCIIRVVCEWCRILQTW